MNPASRLRLRMQEGLQARKEGRLSAAHAAFSEVLQQVPEQPDALYLLAEVTRAQGRLAEAVPLLERSLRVQPQQAHAWFRLGDAQEELGHWDTAVTCYERALQVQPAFVQAQYNRARLLRLLGHAHLATQALDQALQQPGADPELRAQMLQLAALLFEDAGELEAALGVLDQALAQRPLKAALHHNRGVLLQRLARPREALAAHARAAELGLDAADAHYNRGNSLQSLGRMGDALAAYREALLRQPLHELSLYDCARLRWRMGDAEFTQELDEAIRTAPDSAVALGIKGRLLLRAERHADAAQAYELAAQRSPSTAAYLDGLGQALSRLGRHDEALAAHRRAVERAPQEAATHISYASSLLLAGQADAAAREAETAVGLDPSDQQAWAFMGLAWRAAGDEREHWLNDYARHVQVFDLPPPEGWGGVAAFNQALADALEQLHTDTQEPVDQTLRRGTQTLGNIFEQPLPLLKLLESNIRQAVDSYLEWLRALPEDRAHPLLGRLAPSWRFSDSWSSRLRSGGFHTNHVHAHGWISSCYYVALPPSVSQPSPLEPSHPGWIAFGEPDMAVPGHLLGERRVVQPQVGRLVLFPSFMWHGTKPFNDMHPRLTVAFDIMPVTRALPGRT